MEYNLDDREVDTNFCSSYCKYRKYNRINYKKSYVLCRLYGVRCRENKDSDHTCNDGYYRCSDCLNDREITEKHRLHHRINDLEDTVKKLEDTLSKLIK